MIFRFYLRLFETLDKDHNGLVSAAELRALFIGIQSEDTDLLDMSNHVDNVMNYIDRSGDLHIDVDEFIQRTSEWLNKAKYTRDDAVNDIGRRTIKKCSFKTLHKVLDWIVRLFSNSFKKQVF